MLRVAYSGSWFDNLAPTLIWDSPLKIDDAADKPGARPHVAVAVRFRRETICFPWLHEARAQDAGHRLLLPTACGATTSRWNHSRSIRRWLTIPLPRANTDAEAHVLSTNLNLTSRPSTDWRFGARFRNYTYSNEMPATSITQYNNCTTRASGTMPTGGPDLYAH